MTTNNKKILEHILEIFPDYTIALLENKIVDFNSKVKKDFKFIKKGKKIEDFIFANDVDKIIQLFNSSNNEKKYIETQICFGNNFSIDIEISFSKYKISKNEIYTILFFHNISEIKKKEVDHLRFANVVHNAVNPIEITDINGNIVYVNPAFEKESGFKKEKLIGGNPRIFSSGKHPKGFWEKMWKTISSGKVWTGEVQNKRANGEPFYAHLLVSPIIDGNKQIMGYLGIHTDITEKKYLEQQLVHAQKMESIGTLTAGMAHEVGNPLTSISALVQILQRSTEENFILEKLEMIKTEISRISRILRDMVNFSRRSSYNYQFTDLNKILRESVDLIKVGKKSKGIIFDLSLDQKIPALYVVPDQMQQVFVNLLINSVDALHDVEIKNDIQKKISIETKLEKENLLIKITDNGIGIKEENIGKIFEPFFTTKQVGEGTGLGLWISYGIIKNFQGDIKVESEYKTFTSFTITFSIKYV